MNAHGFLHPGRFSVRLMLQQRIESDDGHGGFTGAWQDIEAVWAGIVPVEGIVTRQADNTQTAITHWIYVRQRGDVLPGMRLAKAGRIFDIETVLDPDETGRYQVLKCVERS
ncbi:MAG: phage head closure protein [Nitratireductor sp.]|nr:phage head closure protein [Nitratireductor sp.]